MTRGATWHTLCASACAVGLLAGEGTAGEQASRLGSSRTTAVVSDLHMGEGRDGAGTWLATEDFRWAADFSAFLSTIDREGKSAVDLVVNGDAFDLWQSSVSDCAPRDSETGCTEAELRARLDRAIRGHRDELAAFGRFAAAGSNRVAFVAGDHDAALSLPSVARRLTDAVAAPEGRVVVMPGDHWLSRDGRLYTEHGHRIGESPEAVDAETNVKTAAGRNLRRLVAERVLQPLWDKFEPAYPAVDNFAMVGAGLRYALAAETTTDLGERGRGLLNHFLFSVAWQQFRMDIDGGDTEAPTWDLTKVRAEGPAWLVASFPDDDPFKKVVASDLTAGRLAGVVDAYSDDQLVAICDYRATVRRARRRLEAITTQLSGRGPVVTECPRMPDSRGAQFEYFWRSRDRVFGRHLERVEARLRRPSRSIGVFVHGHTHLPDRSQAGNNATNGDFKIVPEGFSPIRGAFSPVVINGGAWQRTITPVQFDRLKAERGVSDRDLLASLRLEQLAPCYSFVLIPPYAEADPAPAVRYWRQAPDGRWAVAAGCGS